MKTRRGSWWMFMLLPLLVTGGCATGSLWDGRLNATNGPAPDAHLRLFQDEPRQDVLVVYQEMKERNDKIRTRAYYLFQNEERLRQNHTPLFVKPESMAGLPEVPVFPATNAISGNPTPILCAMVNTNGQEFTLYKKGLESGEYQLPTYDDGRGKWECVALTPLAAGADVTLVGGYLGYLWLESGGPETFVRR